jgi:addiction module RelB/DinJ family antitoxin
LGILSQSKKRAEPLPLPVPAWFDQLDDILTLGVQWQYKAREVKIMSEARLNVRVDENTKKQAEIIFQRLGFTMSAGINIFLSRVAATQGIPFPLQLDSQETLGEKALAFEKSAIGAARARIVKQKENAVPIALFDAVQMKPYLEYPDGRKDYSLD